jgi:hypothetical protein
VGQKIKFPHTRRLIFLADNPSLLFPVLGNSACLVPGASLPPQTTVLSKIFLSPAAINGDPKLGFDGDEVFKTPVPNLGRRKKLWWRPAVLSPTISPSSKRRTPPAWQVVLRYAPLSPSLP